MSRNRNQVSAGLRGLRPKRGLSALTVTLAGNGDGTTGHSWQVQDGADGPWVEVDNALTFTPTEDLVGMGLRVVVTFTNSAGEPDELVHVFGAAIGASSGTDGGTTPPPTGGTDGGTTPPPAGGADPGTDPGTGTATVATAPGIRFVMAGAAGDGRRRAWPGRCRRPAAGRRSRGTRWSCCGSVATAASCREP